jgi:hypothetical protein
MAAVALVALIAGLALVKAAPASGQAA